MKIKDLTLPIVAAKSDWLAAEHWIGFTPAQDTPSARAQCISTIARQARGGYVIEYITRTFGEPNAGYENDPLYRAEHAAHAKIAGRLIGVHRLRPAARSLLEIVGETDFKRLQDMWATDGKRYRWSVAFPIVESYAVVDPPKASDVFGKERMQRIFGHPSATLRPLQEIEAGLLAELEIRPIATASAWILIEDEIAMAEGSQIDSRIQRLINEDLNATALEGMTEEQKLKVRKRAAWLASAFVLERRKNNSLHCDDCGFNPIKKIGGVPINPRSLLDVHHKYPLEEGARYTTKSDFALLCPTCHRYAHALIACQRRDSQAA